MMRTRPASGLIEQKPRKMLKLDLIHQKQYNEFEGNSDIDQEPLRQSKTQHHENARSQNNKVKQEKQLDLGIQINQNQKIYHLIAHQHLKFRKVNDLTQPKQTQPPKQLNPLKKQTSSVRSVKFEEGTEPPTVKTEDPKATAQTKTAKKQKAKPVQPSSNWKKFLQNAKTPHRSVDKAQNNSTINSQKPFTPNEPSKFVAMDCEFVKCNESDELARISIVSETGQTLYDSYIKPETQVTDFVTEITGITYTHIKQAPKWSTQIAKVKKILMGKIVVGHTLDKDLEVTKLTNWKGISQKINIAQFSEYKQKGGSKVVSLKRMALSFLNRNIQSGWHSSVEDAVATMDLFKLNKKKILKELKLI